MKLFKLSFLTSLLLSMQVLAAPEVVSKLDMEDGKIPNDSRCNFGAQYGGVLVVSKDTQVNYMKSKGSLKGSYPIASGGMYIWGGCDVADLSIRDVYIEFYAKMPLPVKQGLKFVKIFGQTDSGGGVANTTVSADYTGIDAGKGTIYQVSFGDGSSKVNDSQNVINLSGVYPEWIGRSYGVAQVYTSGLWAASNWGDAWHHFRIHVKYNSGVSVATEQADGEYYLEIDGKVYADAKKLFNRHYSNKPIQKVAFFDWAQGGTDPFEIWYDDIVITTGGFLSKANPKSVNVIK